MIILANIRTKYSKFSALRANRGRTLQLWEFFVAGKQGRNKYIFILGGGRNKSFWPKYLPLNIDNLYPPRWNLECARSVPQSAKVECMYCLRHRSFKEKFACAGCANFSKHSYTFCASIPQYSFQTNFQVLDFFSGKFLILVFYPKIPEV